MQNNVQNDSLDGKVPYERILIDLSLPIRAHYAVDRSGSNIN